MRSYLENRYSMSKVVQSYMEEQDAATLNTAPGLEQDVALLKEINDQINFLHEFQIMNRTGHYDKKETAKELLINSALSSAFALMAFAKAIPDPIMYKEVKTARYELLNSRDSKLIARCELLHERATEHQTSIENFGITVAFLNQFLEEINEFREQASQPRRSIANRVQLTNKMEIEFKKQLDLLKEMDIKVKALKLLFPDFVNEYETCRIIVNYRGSLLAISGNIKDQAGNPIFGAICTLTELGREAKSTAKGNFEFKNVANGKYNLQIQRPGYETINQIVSVVKGETTKVFIVMTIDTSLLRVA